MAWIYRCVLYIMLLQISVQGFGTLHAAAGRSERSAGQKTNGSYKIVNRYGKPFVNKRVPDGSVVFPGLTSRSGGDISLQIPEECKRLGICNLSLGYKDDVVESIVQDLIMRNKTFNSDVLEAPQIAERIGPEEDTQELCNSSEQLYAPKLAQDAEKQWHRIINTATNAQQRFRVEICKGQFGAPCSSVAIFQDGYQSQCVQKYVLRNMMALNDRDEVVEKPFLVPNCCSCVAKIV